MARESSWRTSHNVQHKIATNTIWCEIKLVREGHVNSKNIVLFLTLTSTSVFCPKNIFFCLRCFYFIFYREVNVQTAALWGLSGNRTMVSLGIHFYLTAHQGVGSTLRVAVWGSRVKTTNQPPHSFFLRVTGFVKTVSMTRLRRRFLLVVGTSPSVILFRARGSGSAGLGRGEIRSTSATGSGSTAGLDLKRRVNKRWCFWAQTASDSCETDKLFKMMFY